MLICGVSTNMFRRQAKLPSRFWKAVVIVTAGLVILFIGFSRLFVGDHYLTDVLAGYTLGVALCGLVYTLVEVIARKMEHRPSGKKQAA